MPDEPSAPTPDGKSRRKRTSYIFLSVFLALLALAGAVVLREALRPCPAPRAAARIERVKALSASNLAMNTAKRDEGAKRTDPQRADGKTSASLRAVAKTEKKGSAAKGETGEIRMIDDETIRRICEDYGIPDGDLFDAGSPMLQERREGARKLNQDFEIAKMTLAQDILMMPGRDGRTNEKIISAHNYQVHKLSVQAGVEAYLAFRLKGETDNEEAWRRCVDPALEKLRGLSRSVNEAKIAGLMLDRNWTQAALTFEKAGDWPDAAWCWKQQGGRYATARRIAGGLDHMIPFLGKNGLRDILAPYYVEASSLAPYRDPVARPLPPSVNVMTAGKEVWLGYGWTAIDFVRVSDELQKRGNGR